MIDIILIESACKKMALENLPALKQLKIAIDNKEEEIADRIGKNILSYLKLYRPSIAQYCDKNKID